MMQARKRDDGVFVSMTDQEARDLLREIDKWPDLPKVEQDLVAALKDVQPHGSEAAPTRAGSNVPNAGRDPEEDRTE
jgi:hypothetical protein